MLKKKESDSTGVLHYCSQQSTGAEFQMLGLLLVLKHAHTSSIPIHNKLIRTRKEQRYAKFLKAQKIMKSNKSPESHRSVSLLLLK